MSRAMLALLRFYRLRISTHTRPSCRFVPSCSEYAAEAIECYGAVLGGALAVWRVLRCNPLSKGGYDPVPKYYS
ncbi:MAG: membrane protein insertion efficiency factor YidD [Oscillospiraceae bacterium]|jgi:putative membrane protein insertion efficiency factor|nr:membrane protein insertion efficiency factor YidD [Oscillospiraceae bacterium]